MSCEQEFKITSVVNLLATCGNPCFLSQDSVVPGVLEMDLEDPGSIASLPCSVVVVLGLSPVVPKPPWVMTLCSLRFLGQLDATLLDRVRFKMALPKSRENW